MNLLSIRYQVEFYGPVGIYKSELIVTYVRTHGLL